MEEYKANIRQLLEKVDDVKVLRRVLLILTRAINK